MMKNEKEVVKHLNWNINLYQEDKGKLFPDDNGMGEYYEENIEDAFEIIEEDGGKKYALTVLGNFSYWHLDYSQYLLLHKNNPTASLEEFTKSALYGYLAMRATDEGFGGWGGNNDGYIPLYTSSLYASQSILCGWWEEGYDLNDRMIISIDYGTTADSRGEPVRRVIMGGHPYTPANWFLLELYCKINFKEFNRDNASYPESMIPYDQVLDKWDTRDLVEVDRLVYLMGDQHLEQAQEEKNEGDFDEFFINSTELLPYEILTWLAYRTKAGLPNPSEFSHPLMNTPLARIFLELKTPLAKPKELPYAKELLGKLKEACPQIEVEI